MRVLKGQAAADGGAPPYQMIAPLSLASLEAFQGAMQVHGAEIIGDVSRFTDAQPSIQVNAAVG